MGDERSPDKNGVEGAPKETFPAQRQSVQVCGGAEEAEGFAAEVRAQGIAMVVEAMLEGYYGPVGVAECTGIDLEVVRIIMNKPELAKAYATAKRNYVQSAIERLERRVHRNLAVVEKLTVNNDPRVRLEAARDQLNRTPGLAPGAKVEVGLSAYKKMVERYIEPDKDED